MNTFDQIARANLRLLSEEPFFAHLLCGLARERSDRHCRRLCIYAVPDHLVLSVHPELERLTPGMLKHELLHLIFGHPEEALLFSDAFLFNLAADLQVNQYLSKGQLSEDALLPDRFPELELPARQSVSYYYQALTEAETFPGARAELEQIRSNADALFDGHHVWWKKSEPMTSSLRLALVFQAGRESGAGTIPADLERALSGAIPRSDPAVNWRRALRLFASGGSRNQYRPTIRRPSKRYGTTPGLKLKRRHRLMVGIDTSGSIGAEVLGLFFDELFHLWKTGVSLEVAEFDARVQRVWKYRGRRPEKVKGGGGTSFEPFLKLANTYSGLDGLLIFTDGWAPVPEQASRQALLWVISPDGVGPAHSQYQRLPGRKLKMEWNEALV